MKRKLDTDINFIDEVKAMLIVFTVFTILCWLTMILFICFPRKDKIEEVSVTFVFSVIFTLITIYCSKIKNKFENAEK